MRPFSDLHGYRTDQIPIPRTLERALGDPTTSEVVTAAAINPRIDRRLRRPAKGRLQGLDVLRGFAILLVMLRHSWGQYIGGGGVVGVTMFFALSGYLITGVLSSDRRRHGSVSYWRFYRNRILRLYPALLAMLIGLSIASLTFDRLHERSLLGRTAGVGAAYISDLPLHIEVSPAIGHLWTLSTEEQFYLVWPVLLMIAYRRRMLDQLICVSSIVVMLLVAASVVVERHEIANIYTLPTSWAIILIIGAAGYIYRDRLAASFLGTPGAGALSALILAGLTVPQLKNQAVTYFLGAPAIGVCSVSLILCLARWNTVHAALQPFRWLGLISYATYLWNYPISLWVRGPNSDTGATAQGVEIIALSIAAGTISWFALERPIYRWRQKLDNTSGRSRELVPEAAVH